MIAFRPTISTRITVTLRIAKCCELNFTAVSNLFLSPTRVGLIVSRDKVLRVLLLLVLVLVLVLRLGLLLWIKTR